MKGYTEEFTTAILEEAEAGFLVTGAGFERQKMCAPAMRQDPATLKEVLNLKAFMGMRMIDHFEIKVKDLQISEGFYREISPFGL